MTTITIRNVPKETHDELVSRASASGKSLQEYLRAELIRLASKPDMESWLAGLREEKRRQPISLTTEQILRARDSGRR